MLPNDSFMPKSDTQNKWEFGYWKPVLTKRNKNKAFKDLRKQPNCGVYGVFHQVGYCPRKCLYIGASIRLRTRVARFVNPKARIGNFYLQAIMNAVHSLPDDTVHFMKLIL